MRRIRRERRSTQRCVSSGAPLENTRAAGSFGDNQDLIGGWGGVGWVFCHSGWEQLAEFVTSEFANLAFSLSDCLKKTEVESRGCDAATLNEISYWPREGAVISSRGRRSLLPLTLTRVLSRRRPGHLSPTLVPLCSHHVWPWCSSSFLPALDERWSSRLGWSNPLRGTTF